MFFRVVLQDGGGWWAVEMTCTCLGDFYREVQMRQNEETIERRISL